MPHRDELGAALSRIAALEAELKEREAREAGASDAGDLALSAIYGELPRPPRDPGPPGPLPELERPAPPETASALAMLDELSTGWQEPQLRPEAAQPATVLAPPRPLTFSDQGAIRDLSLFYRRLLTVSAHSLGLLPPLPPLPPQLASGQNCPVCVEPTELALTHLQIEVPGKGLARIVICPSCAAVSGMG